MRTLIFLLLCSVCFGKEPTHPYQILIFRHAEKFKIPGDLDAPLNEKGQKRAAYLVDFFMGGNQPIIELNDHEIGAVCVPKEKGTKDGKPYSYVRATQTIIPLFHVAQAYRMENEGKQVELIDSLPFSDPLPLFDNIIGNPLFAEKTVIVCWEHLHIPSLFNTHFPQVKKELKHLGEERYDVVWMIRWKDDKPYGTTLYQKEDL